MAAAKVRALARDVESFLYRIHDFERAQLWRNGEPSDGRAFDDFARAQAWVLSANAKHDVYVQYELVRSTFHGVKAKAEHIESTRFLKADVDPPTDVWPEGVKKLTPAIEPGWRAWCAKARAALVDAWDISGIPVPTLRLYSGRGFQFIWELTEPCTDKDTAVTVNAWLRDILRAHGWKADSVQSWAQVMRLPFTINHKTGERGALLVDTGARYVRRNLFDTVYAASARATRATAESPKAQGDAARLESTTAAVPPGLDLDSVFKKAAATGRGDRSRVFSSVVGSLRWLATAAEILAVCEAHPEETGAEKYDGRLGEEVLRVLAKGRPITERDYAPAPELFAGWERQKRVEYLDSEGAKTESVSSRARFTLYSRAQLASIPKPAPLIEKVLVRKNADDAPFMIYGRTGGGKTWNGLEMIRAVAEPDQKSFYGQKALVTGTAVYLAMEAFAVIAERTRGMMSESADVRVVRADMLDLMNDDDIRELINLLRPLKPELVILDNLHHATPGTNINRQEDASRCIRNMQILCRELSGRFGFIHYPPQPLTERATATPVKFRRDLRPSGAMAIEAGCDVCFSSQIVEGGQGLFRIEKNWYGDAYRDLSYFEIVDGRPSPIDDDPGKAGDLTPAQAEALRVLQMLAAERSDGLVPFTEWRDALIKRGFAKGTISKVRKALRDAGLIKDFGEHLELVDHDF